MEEASSAGHVLLRRMIKLHYNWKYNFIRPTAEEVCARYLAKHGQGGARETPPPAPAAEGLPSPRARALARGRGGCGRAVN
eukprot:5966760-Prymnesium_polylepis.1